MHLECLSRGLQFRLSEVVVWLRISMVRTASTAVPAIKASHIGTPNLHSWAHHFRLAARVPAS